MGSLRRRSLALVLPMLLLAAAAGGETADGWTSRGPFCARPLGLAGNKALAYLTVGGSLFRSRDGWATWSRVGEELPASDLSAVAVAPRNPRLVYFVIWNGGGVFRSRDGGESWSRVFSGLPDPLVENLVVPAGPAGTVFAIAPSSGIYRSRNQGETWTDVSPHEGPPNYTELIVHPLHPERLAARTQRGIWRSNDGGDTWKPWNAGLPIEDDSAVGLSGLTLSPDDQDIAFLTYYQTLYRSQGGGLWTRVGPVPVNSFAYVKTLVAGPGRVPVLFAGQDEGAATTPGVLRSRNGGKTWTPVSLRGETVHRLTYLPVIGRLIALTERGAFQSSDLGATWQRTGDGIAASRVRALAAAGGAGKVLVAGLEGCSGFIGRSSDGGKSWKLQDIRKPDVPYGPGYLHAIEAAAFAPSQPLRVYAAGIDEVLRSADGGLTWKHFSFSDGIGGGHSAAVAVHPTNPDLVFVAGQHGLSRSFDGGRTWGRRLHGDPYDDMTAVVFAPGRPQRMLAASWSGGLVRSVDTGASWEPIPGTDILRIGALAIDPRDPDVVLASALFDGDAIYRSLDGGSTWVISDIGITGRIGGLAFSADGSEVVAAGNAGAFVSRNGGQTWQRIDGAPAPAQAILLTKNGALHVGTDAGVVSSQDAAQKPIMPVSAGKK